MTPVVLSICVPAYNRRRYLPELLASVEAQWRPGVELCVSDNASDDGSAEWLEEQSRRLPWLRWESRGTNVGPDRNYFFAAGMARGEWVWLMGSDDALAPGGLDAVLELLERDGPDVLQFSFQPCDMEMKPTYRYQAWRTIVGERLLEGRAQDSVQTMFEEANHLGSLLTYLSNVVVRRTLWTETPAWLPSFGTGYAHTCLFLDGLQNHPRLLLSDREVVLYRTGNDSFETSGVRRRRQLDFDGLQLVLEHAFPKSFRTKERLIELLRKDHRPDSLAYFAVARLRQPEASWKDYRDWLVRSYGWSWHMRAASVLPRAVLQAAWNTVRRLRGQPAVEGGVS